MPPYDLRTQPWIPWRRRDGSVHWGSPSLLLHGLSGDNPVVDMATTRVDFDAALLEFIVGIYAAALAPVDDEAWHELWKNPPTVAAFENAMAALPSAFNLCADAGPLFMQDFSAADLADQDVLPVERLIIDSPGEQTLKLNKAHFVRPSRFDVLGLPAAAMALLTMQTYAPSGGAGNRTSMRGGGPLTTLVDPRSAQQGLSPHRLPLWQKVWMNVPTRENLKEVANAAIARDGNAAELVFPWLAATRVSVKGKPPVTPLNAHALQAFFGMPRRVRLEFSGPGRCELTGTESDITVRGFRLRNYGVNYEGWEHPFSPHYRQTEGAEWLPVHGQPGGLGWRVWPGFSMFVGEGNRKPAAVVRWAQQRCQLLPTLRLRLHAFGFDLDNMKARGWVDATQPLHLLDAPQLRRLHTMSANMVEAAGLISSQLARQIKMAEFGEDKGVGGDWGWVREELHDLSEAAFFEAVQRCASAGVTAAQVHEESAAFLRTLSTTALDVFDAHCQAEGTNVIVLRRVVIARAELRRCLSGYTPLGEKLFKQLDVPLPGGGRAQRTTTKKAGKSRHATSS